MSDLEAPAPPLSSSRQVLVAIGNRHVVFGSGATLRDAPRFGPGDVRKRLPRVGDDREGVERRIVESMIVEGCEVYPLEGEEFGDVQIVDAEGRRTIVEIRVGDRDFAGVDLGRAWKELGGTGEHREIWGFNLERLSLGMVWSGDRFGSGFAELPALDVWEFNQDGSVFDRSHVVAELDDWSRRIALLYDEVEAWVHEEGLTTLRDRTIPMSEELMQKFAVPDRDMPILDVMDGSTPVATLKPDGLWLIGINGLIDVITRRGTVWLAGTPKWPEPPAWTVVEPRDRTRSEWDKDRFLALLDRAPALGMAPR